MTCPVCASWCATSDAMLKNRQKNMAGVPGATVHSCPQCGGTDWATSRDQIKPGTAEKPWWRRLPSWQQLRVANAVAAVFCFAVAGLVGPSATGMTAAFVAGWNTAAMFYCTYQMRSVASFDKFKDAFNEMQQLNNALLANKVALHVMSIHGEPDDDSPPTAPTLQ